MSHPHPDLLLKTGRRAWFVALGLLCLLLGASTLAWAQPAGRDADRAARREARRAERAARAKQTPEKREARGEGARKDEGARKGEGPRKVKRAGGARLDASKLKPATLIVVANFAEADVAVNGIRYPDYTDPDAPPGIILPAGGPHHVTVTVGGKAHLYKISLRPYETRYLIVGPGGAGGAPIIKPMRR